MGILDDIKKLPPEQQAKELQKFIENTRKELAQKSAEIAMAEQFLSEATRETEVLERKQRDTLETAVFKENKTARKEEPALEKLVEEKPNLARATLRELDRRLDELYQRQRDTGIETPKDREDIYAIRKTVYEKEVAIQRGTYQPRPEDRELFGEVKEHANTLYKQSSLYRS